MTKTQPPKPGLTTLLIRSTLRLGLFTVVVLACFLGLEQFRPRGEQAVEVEREGEDYGLAHDSALRQPLTLLLLGLEPVAAERQRPPRANGIMLVRLQPDQPLRILQIPAQTAVSVPGSGIIPVGEAYSVGGVRLVADLLAELLGRQEANPVRYIVGRASSLATAVDALGGIPMTLDPPPAPRPKAQPAAKARPVAGDQAATGARPATGTVAEQAPGAPPEGAVAAPPPPPAPLLPDQPPVAPPQDTANSTAGSGVPLPSGPQQLSGEQVERYLRDVGPLAPTAWRLERQRRLIGAMARVFDGETVRRRWSQLAQDWLATSQTNLSDEELFSLLALLSGQPLVPVVQSLPLQPAAAETTVRAWLDNEALPPETVLVEGPAAQATAFRRQLQQAGTTAQVQVTPADGVRLRQTRLLAWGEEPPESVQELVGNNALRNDAPAAPVGITVRLGADWPR